jgi:hypothetical protein
MRKVGVFHSHILALSNMDTKARRPPAGVRAGPKSGTRRRTIWFELKTFQGGTKIERALPQRRSDANSLA